MTTGTRGTETKRLESHNTQTPSHKNIQTHTGKLDVHKCEAVCWMPVFFRQGCRGEGAWRRRSRRRDEGEVGGGGVGLETGGG